MEPCFCAFKWEMIFNYASIQINFQNNILESSASAKIA